MPIYEYRCTACRHEFEELIRSAEASQRVRCPACGASEIERKLSVFSAHQPSGSDGDSGPGCGRCGDPYGPCGYD